MEQWIPLITDVGFPVVVTFYLLHRIEGKMNLLIESLHTLPEKMRHALGNHPSELLHDEQSDQASRSA